MQHLAVNMDKNLQKLVLQIEGRKQKIQEGATLFAMRSVDEHPKFPLLNKRTVKLTTTSTTHHVLELDSNKSQLQKNYILFFYLQFGSSTECVQNFFLFVGQRNCCTIKFSLKKRNDFEASFPTKETVSSQNCWYQRNKKMCSVELWLNKVTVVIYLHNFVYDHWRM